MVRYVAALALLGWYLLIPPVHVKNARPHTETSPTQPAKGRFLVASHRLTDPNFFETVVLLLAYEPTGALGVVINRPTDIRLGSVLRDVEELRDRSDPVYLGGPVVQNLLLVLLRAARQPESSEAIFDGVYVSGSRAAVREVLKKAGKRNRVRGYAGYAAWAPGQLEREIAHGDWHVTTADATIVFDTTASAIWPRLIQRFSGEWTRREMPIDFAMLKSSAFALQDCRSSTGLPAICQSTSPTRAGRMRNERRVR
jgi:putative transcriptional regulator